MTRQSRSFVRIASIVCLWLCGSVVPPALAQVNCPPLPPANIVAFSTPCPNPPPLLTWTNPPNQTGTVVVLRSTTPNFGQALFVGAASIGTSQFEDASAPTNVDLFYWLAFQSSNAGCTGSGSISAFDGPFRAQRVSLGSSTLTLPPPSITINCSTVTLTWLPVRGATSAVVRRINPNATFTQTTLPGDVSTFIDFTGTAGSLVSYQVFFTSVCRGTEATNSTAAVRFPAVVGTTAITSRDVRVGESATLSIALSFISPEVTSVEWSRDGVPVADDPRISGLNTLALTINPVRESDMGIYTARVNNACGTAGTFSSALIVRACRLDFDGSGAASLDDVFLFLKAWFAGCP